MKHLLLSFSILIFTCVSIYAQNENVQVGSSINQLRIPSAGAFYDYSDPGSVNIKVAVWGWVRFPGKYIVPVYSNVNDLLSYAGGPTDEAHLEELRLFRTNSDSTQSLIKLSYNDVRFEPGAKDNPKIVPLKAGDILLVTGEPRLYFRDYLSVTLSVVSTLISLAILIITIKRG